MAGDASAGSFRQFIGWAGGSFFFFCALIAARRVFNPPLVTLSNDGIRDTRISSQIIPWSAVEKISIGQVQYQRFLVLKVTHEHKQKLNLSLFGKWLNSTNQIVGVDGLSIGLVEFSIKFDEFYATVGSFARAHGIKVE